ncbi:acyl transferase [Roseivirga pacifica]|uniref:LuxE/PaaK family acyltransferase n=1 Tax=Roseivirga pacifica TaxID=1267423 RepID=UPI002094A100|nr:acyl transferase [Roseivirga pacifica]MCO6357627.1 acyl transferase [Roseivirga pacifica]MCO6365880.1 acyl transferase [Roseivirga pacifica]MCO6371208.1 acyl transferase [Roseivirga pacifica]MCO6375621.1 acyl transferase [Roseivirga pacifica]MCO6378586.1 acyl transferase [Roseivirga pacifica]
MGDLNSLISNINSVNQNTFESVALQVFKYQFEHCSVYHQYVQALGRPMPQSLLEIPFLPIEFFKNHSVKSGNWKSHVVFESSGTTGASTSRHQVRDEGWYIDHCIKTFEVFYGKLDQFTLLALLPSYIERGNSGLISMVNAFIEETGSSNSGFYLNEFEALVNKLKELRRTKKPTILWGVTFGLLDFVEQYQIDFPDLIVMETGGMKGRREELTRVEVHGQLTQGLGVDAIHSEYGMTELFSQAYSKGDGLFLPSTTMKVFARDMNDPLSIVKQGKTGALNIIDLLNVNTCSFIETKDLTRVYEDGTFEVLGRMDNSDIRGCNLLVV